MDWVQLGITIFMVVYIFCLVMLSVYGLHRYGLVYLYYRHRGKKPEPAGEFQQLPRVTIQLPMYNERHVVRRVIEKACEIDYPRELLDIQVLDDSTDDTSEIIKEAVAEARAKGFDIEYLHRADRTGYKGGNLAFGMKHVKGEFVTIFDVDFVPDPEILKRSIHYFVDPKIALVQTRWEHLNRDDSLLTKSQAILLDGHFVIEQVARNRSDRFITFNGTAGTWRAQAIRDAGGWHHDTLTEDLDLSFRAQMRGWKFVFLPDLTAPAELPPEMTGFKTQQFRWTKGGAQTAMKLLPKVLMSHLPLKVKVEAFFQLTCFTLHLYMALLVVMMFPAMLLRSMSGASMSVWRAAFDISVFLLGALSGSVFYLAGQLEILRNWRSTLKFLPIIMSLGIGLSVSNTKAVIEALVGKKSDFVSTPKFGDASSAAAVPSAAVAKKSKGTWLPYVEFAMGVYMTACLVWSVTHYGICLLGVPFLILFAFGFFYVSVLSFQETWAKARASAPVKMAKAAETVEL